MTVTLPVDEEKRDFCMRMGLALAVWQNVETQHYHLFLNLLGIADERIASVVYFSTESFEARRIMVHRMVECFPTTKKKLRVEWNELSKELKTANGTRNKIAHYEIAYPVYESKSEKDKVHVGSPILMPSLYNQVSKLLGRSDPAHSPSADELDQYIRDFGNLATRVCRFGIDCAAIRWPGGGSRRPPPPTFETSPPPPLSRRRSKR
jgi:hypothetical protein